MAIAARATLRIVLTTVAVPLMVLGLGIWEVQRGTWDQRDLELQRDHLGQVVARMQAQLAAEPGRHMQLQFRRDGQLYVGAYAIDKAREAVNDAENALEISRWRRVLPPVTIACAGLTALLSVLVLAGAAVLARAGRASRDALIRGFSVLHRLMPPLLCLQMLLVAAFSVTVVAFETMAILEIGDFSSGSLKVLAVAVMLIGASLWTAIKAVLQLRQTAALFTPDPMTILGRPVSAEAAPGLWRMLDDLAQRLGALPPNDVVVGLTGSFFVSSGPKLLQPGDVPLQGRTLYLPLPYLPLLRADELSAIIGHELAHFTGSDTEYSLRFLPIYAGVERSLDAVLAAGTTSAGSLSLLARPALRLGMFAMEQFHRTVRHWSRVREFAADTAGARVSSTNAAARALLRVAAADTLVDRTLAAAFRAPASTPDDLVTGTLTCAITTGLDDPADQLENRQAHPTDTHPPTYQRLAALGREPDAAALAEAVRPPSPDAMPLLSTLFADAGAVCRTATTDFLDIARARARSEHQALEEAAAAVDTAEQTFYETARGTYFLVSVTVAFLLFGALILVIGVTRLSWAESQLVGGFALVCGLGFAGWSAIQLRRGKRPLLLLRPDGLDLPGLDRPIAWAHVLDLDVAVERGRVSTRVLLAPEAPFPGRKPGGRRVKLDAKQRVVTFTGGPPRGMQVQGYADLLGRYWRADTAGRLLAAGPQLNSMKE